MLYIPWMVFLGDHKIKEDIFSHFKTSKELLTATSCVSKWCTKPLGDTTRTQYPNNVNYTSWTLISFGDHIKAISFANFDG